MDPISALGMASNIAQLVELGSKIVSRAFDFYQSTDGVIFINRNLEVVTRDLTELCMRLDNPEILAKKDSFPPKVSVKKEHSASKVSVDKESSASEVAIVQLARTCQGLGLELLDMLQKLKIGGNKKKWESVRQAVRSTWQEKPIQAMKNV